MDGIIRGNGSIVLVLACALLWANVASALPWNRITEERASAAGDEVPVSEYAPPTYPVTTDDEIPCEAFVVAAAEDTWTCPNCNRENPADAEYCSGCGAKKGEATPRSDLSGVRVCPKCGFVNEKGARFCGDCGYDFGGEGVAAGELEIVYVPGRGYLPKGTMIKPGHARTGLWVTGLIMWFLAGPGIAAAGAGDDSKALYIMGGAVYLTGQILFIVGVGAKTEPVYASRTTPDDDFRPRLAYAPKSPEPDGFAVKVELPLLSF
jgi:ribosomal protein L40E